MSFDPKNLVAASKSKEFNGEVAKTPKSILAAAIDKQIQLFKNPKEEGRRWFTIGDKEVALKLKFANKSIPLVGDEDTVVVPRDQVEAAYQYLKAEAEKGAYDKTLATLAEGRAARVEKMRKTRAEKKASPAPEKPAEAPKQEQAPKA